MPESVKRTALWRKITSVSRYFAYRGYRFPAMQYWSPSLGVIVLGVVGAVFFFAMTLGPKPYYWPTDASYGGSPPIATRAGWMALALLPFVLALSAKANMISALTGVPHEKLQVFHHWVSYAMFVLALIHTFPFIVYNISQGDMVNEWKTSLVYWTGIGAIIPQAYLTIMSLPSIRNRFYEFFKATHIIAAVVFVVFFFLHCDFRLSSWDYFVATGTIYLLCLFTAQTRTYLMHGLHNAMLERLPSGLVRVVVPTIIKWTPGQHFFIRFLTPDLHLLTAHPFTISSACNDPDATGKASELVFYIKPHGGVTARLAALAEQRPGGSKRILLEGPYGGVSAPHMARFDIILVIAGGSGGGFSLAMVDEALRLNSLSDCSSTNKLDCENECRRRNLQVVYATRDTAMADWYVEEIESRLSHSTTLSTTADNGFDTSVSVHITSNRTSALSQASSSASVSTSSPDTPSTTAGDEKEKGTSGKDGIETTTTGSFSLNVSRNAHPYIPDLIERTIASAREQRCPGGRKPRIGVVVCGPASMLHDTRNAAAAAQKSVLAGEVEELYLHSEPFAW
ncbi:hypothetical protein N7510_010081 [Penicillium lagena]|uniref:uncharacterized protein n=1 Tax=Penicillium lagena TaxID=94218 RepID=UPI00253FDAAB|nr:uncharacterized protein N7510_010081 [Penicillium lagena]KAJ5604927.1 hypothetical protein N7510_010081 [Penicillium lagena]